MRWEKNAGMKMPAFFLAMELFPEVFGTQRLKLCPNSTLSFKIDDI
jgi:hypothetical protein